MESDSVSSGKLRQRGIAAQCRLKIPNPRIHNKSKEENLDMNNLRTSRYGFYAVLIIMIAFTLALGATTTAQSRQQSAIGTLRSRPATAVRGWSCTFLRQPTAN
jgi:hypothetical protein